MPKVRPAQAKEAIQKFATWFVGICETLEAIEQGQHPVVAVKGAIKKAKKRKKNAKAGKRLRKNEHEIIDVEVVPVSPGFHKGKPK